jgi:hypothetical protein
VAASEVKLRFHGLEIVEIHILAALFIGVFGPRHSVQEVEDIYISNQGLNRLSVRIRRNLVKNMVGKIPFGGEDSWSETIMAWASAGHLAVRWDMGLALDRDNGPRRSWLGYVIRKKRRGLAGPAGLRVVEAAGPRGRQSWAAAGIHVKNREREERLSWLGFYPCFGAWPIEK